MQEIFGNYTVETGAIDGTTMSLEVISSQAAVQQKLQDMKEIENVLKSMPRKSNIEKKLLADLEDEIFSERTIQPKGKVLNIILFSQVRVVIEEKQADLLYQNLYNFALKIKSKAYLRLAQNEPSAPQSFGMKALNVIGKILMSNSGFERIYLGGLLGKDSGNMTPVTVIHPTKEGRNLSIEIDEYQFPADIFDKMLARMRPAKKEEG